MAIKTVEMDSRDSVSYRGYLKRCGYISASYLSVSGFDASRSIISSPSNALRLDAGVKPQVL